MNIAISIAEHELEMAHRWFDWCIELGGTNGHSLYLIPCAGLDIADIRAKANKAFGGRVIVIKDEEAQTSDWQITEPMRSASGPNSSFRQVAWHFYMNKIGPFFWCELDCIPTRRDWLDKLEAEYKVALSKGKPFLGAQVLLESVPEHLTGNSVYPMNVPEEAPTLVMRTEWTPKGQEQAFELAFDIAGAREVVPKAHFTNLIQHKFRYEGFKSRAEFDAVIDPNAVVFHSDKRGTIFPYLRQNLNGQSVPIGETGVHGIKCTCAEKNFPCPFHFRDNQPVDDLAPSPATVLGFARAMDAQTDDAQPKVENRTYSYSDILERGLSEPSGLAPISEPWKNKPDSEQEVRLLCTALATFCKTPVYKHRVRQALREAKIIK